MLMRTFTLPDSPDTFQLGNRPQDPDLYDPLPPGVSVEDITVVRAYQVSAGDLVVAYFPEWTGRACVRVAEHLEVLYRADPHSLADCPCKKCDRCEEHQAQALNASLEEDTLNRLTANSHRYICLTPSDDEGDCETHYRNAPLGIIPAATLAALPGTPPTTLPDLTPAPRAGERTLPQKTADELFSYLVNEADQWQAGTAHEVHHRSEPAALDYLLAHGPMRPHETQTIVTAIRLLDPDRFGPAH
ncbi:hypothetical protein [Streptomyces sp. 8N706]|uniref:hypothetical protein n=1 Tax=Streptomyces sp. 8N706 TaxID=3457416 RepID=UPI003FD0763D